MVLVLRTFAFSCGIVITDSLLGCRFNLRDQAVGDEQAPLVILTRTPFLDRNILSAILVWVHVERPIENGHMANLVAAGRS